MILNVTADEGVALQRLEATARTAAEWMAGVQQIVGPVEVRPYHLVVHWDKEVIRWEERVSSVQVAEPVAAFGERVE